MVCAQQGCIVKRKTCPKCGASLQLRKENFVRVRHPKKPGRWLWKHCRKCERQRQAEIRARILADPELCARARAATREKNRRQRAANPERFRRYQREYRARLKADPERWVEVVLMGKRFAREHARVGRGVDAYRPPANRQEGLVGVGPLREFVRVTFPGWTPEEVAAATRHAVSTRRLRALLNDETTLVRLTTADRLLTAGLGRPDLLNTLYPPEAA